MPGLQRPSDTSSPPRAGEFAGVPPAMTQFTNGRSLVMNTLWSLLGRGAPLLIAIVSIPILLHGLGAAKFGVLNLGWVIVGYLNLFDMGLGRALTLVAADKRAKRQEHEIPHYFWKSLVLLIVLGGVGTLVGIIVSRWLAFSVLTIPRGGKVETLHVFYLLSLALPMQISYSGLQGILEAYQRFRFLGTMQMTMGIFSYVAPLTLLPFTHRLTPIIIVLLIGRGIAWLVAFGFCLKVLPRSRPNLLRGWSDMRSMLSTGGWMTVTNILSPAMDFADRFIIGALLSVASVAYYSAPFDLVIKLLIIPTALSTVIFPAFAASVGSAREHARRLFSRSVRWTFAILFPAVLLLVMFASEFLRLWLGKSFSAESTHVFQILAIGMLAKCVAQMPTALVQGGGRADIYAKIHLIEFPFYLGTVWFLVRPYGINGAAIGWTARILVDTALLMLISWRMLGTQVFSHWHMFIASFSTLAILGVCTLPMPFLMKAVFALVALLAFAYLVWSCLITDDERDLARRWTGMFEIRVRRRVVPQ